MKFLILLAIIFFIINLARSITKISKVANNAKDFRRKSKEKDITDTAVIIEDSTEKESK